MCLHGSCASKKVHFELNLVRGRFCVVRCRHFFVVRAATHLTLFTCFFRMQIWLPYNHGGGADNQGIPE